MKTTKIFTALSIMLVCFSCKKLVEIPQPASTITDVKIFSNDATATSAAVGIYNYMIQNNAGIYSSGQVTIEAGISSDEMIPPNAGFNSYYNNTLLANDVTLTRNFWTPAYYNIYQANAIIEGLQNSNGVSDAVKKELTGEAKFVRAFSHFYLVNLFGDVPLVTQSAWAKLYLLPRTPAADVYKQILLDLKDAQTLLPKEYPASTGGEKIRPNYWAATALLARVYLYLGDWNDAYAQSSALISSGTYALETDLNNVFLKNSSEAIFQLQPVDGSNYSVPEAFTLVPAVANRIPPYQITSQLFTAFEPGDQRQTNWVKSVTLSGRTYRYPYKYKVHMGTPGNISEYYMVLRFAEQYLIRAEAEANGATGGDVAAINDLNVVRARAGLANLSASLTHTEVVAAVAQERKVELFAEWGHRWFDLKRTGQADAVLSLIKPAYKPTSKLFPIPLTELLNDPNLVQNPGYH